MASDAFLPFRDNLDVAAGYGIRAVIQPGGSRRDAEVDRRRRRARHGDGVHRRAPLPSLMKVLIVGGGGREHALAWKCAAAARVTEVLVAPGNAGTAAEPKVRNVDVAADDLGAPGRTSPHASASISPSSAPRGRWSPASSTPSRRRDCACFGPSRRCAQLEGSKAFSKEFLQPPRHPDRALDELHARELRSCVAARASGCRSWSRRAGSRPARAW